MSEKDYVVGITSAPSVGVMPKKPCYLVTLDATAGTGTGKLNKQLKFIAMDKPDLLGNFIQVKGIFCDLSEDEILSKFIEVLTSAPKETIVDIMFPVHKICSIRNLVFNAHKPATLIR